MALSQVRPLLGPLKGEVKEKGVEMNGIDRRTRCRVGELASSPLDVAAAAEIRAVIATALHRTSPKSGGTPRSRSRRAARKEATA